MKEEVSKDLKDMEEDEDEENEEEEEKFLELLEKGVVTDLPAIRGGLASLNLFMLFHLLIFSFEESDDEASRHLESLKQKRSILQTSVSSTVEKAEEEGEQDEIDDDEEDLLEMEMSFMNWRSKALWVAAEHLQLREFATEKIECDMFITFEGERKSQPS